jgi:hypothetical protein
MVLRGPQDRGGRLPPALGADQPERQPVGTGHRSPIPRSHRRRPGRRGLLAGGDQAARPQQDDCAPRPRSSHLRRMAAPREPARPRPRATAQRTPDARVHGGRRLRRTSRPRAAPPANASATGPPIPPPSSPPGRLRSAGWRATACPTARSLPSCSSARTLSNTICTKFSRNSRSLPAISCPVPWLMAWAGLLRAR